MSYGHKGFVATQSQRSGGFYCFSGNTLLFIVSDIFVIFAAKPLRFNFDCLSPKSQQFIFLRKQTFAPNKKRLLWGFFFPPEWDKLGDNPKTWCCGPLLSLTQTQKVGPHTHTEQHTHTHTLSSWLRAAGVPHWITVKKQWRPAAPEPRGEKSGPLSVAPLPAEDSGRDAATEQMMPLGAENNRLLPTHRAAHALLAAHWVGPLCIHSCSKA